MKLESEISQEIQMAGPFIHSHLLRNNSGAFEDKDGRQVRFGLGNVSKKLHKTFRSSDQIGITRILIIPEMVGKTIGIFTAIEVKREGWVFTPNEHELAQLNFIHWVQARGGFAGFATSVADFKQTIHDSIIRLVV